jgi:hypothetical protein
MSRDILHFAHANGFPAACFGAGVAAEALGKDGSA